jgi:putative hydrolase of the HAD superfamily
MNARPAALVVFDLDDTLYLEAEFVRSGFTAVEVALNIEGLAATAWLLHEGGVRSTVLAEALHRHGREPTPTEVARAVAIYRTHRPCIDLAPDADATLATLFEHPDVELALLTDGYAATQRNKIESLSLDRWFPRMVVTDELGPDRAYWKPHPEGFQQLQGEDRSAAECVYVADNPQKDFDAPARLGWHTVRLRRRGGLWECEPDGAAPAEVTISELSSLGAHLRALALL